MFLSILADYHSYWRMEGEFPEFSGYRLKGVTKVVQDLEILGSWSAGIVR